MKRDDAATSRLATTLFESMREEASQGFVPRLGQILQKQGADCIRSVHGAGSQQPRVVAVIPHTNGVAQNDNHKRSTRKGDATTQESQTNNRLSEVEANNSKRLCQALHFPEFDVRLDQEWEETFTPPKYTWKMRREREAEILRQRVLLSDYKKADAHLEAEYTRFQVALKREDIQLDRWKDSLVKVQHRARKQTESSSQVPDHQVCSFFCMERVHFRCFVDILVPCSICSQ